MLFYKQPPLLESNILNIYTQGLNNDNNILQK